MLRDSRLGAQLPLAGWILVPVLLTIGALFGLAPGAAAAGPEADPFVAPACEGSYPAEAARLVTGEQLDNYNSGGIAVLYDYAGSRVSTGQYGNPPGCGVRYVEEVEGAISEWMYCTDMESDSCLGLNGGELEDSHGNPVGPMGWLSANERLSAEQNKVIAYILQTPLTVTPAPYRSWAGTTAANTTSGARLLRQDLVWCVSDFEAMAADPALRDWCTENMSEEKQAEYAALVSEPSEVGLGLAPAATEAELDEIVEITLTTNIAGLPIEVSAEGGEVQVCEGESATLADGVLTFTGDELVPPVTAQLCLTRTEPGTVSVTASVVPPSISFLAWAQAAEQCQVYAAFETTMQEPVVVSATANFSERGAETGGFTVRKILVDEAGLVPADTTFIIEYQVTGGGTEQLSITAGEEITVTDLPLGATVTFAEVSLPEIPGGAWESPVWSSNEITISEGEPGETELVSVTNEFTATEKPAGGGGDKTEKNESTGGSEKLAKTGMDDPRALVAAAFAFFTVGVAAVSVARLRSRT